MKKELKVVLIKEMLMDLPKSAASMLRTKEQISTPPEDRLTSEDWESIMEWLEEIKPGKS